MQVNKATCHKLITAHKGLIEEHGHIVELFPCINAELPRGINNVDKIVNIWIDMIAQQYSAGDAAELVLKAASSGLEVAQGVIEGIDAGVQLAALSAKSAATVSGCVAVGLSGLVIIVDLGFLIKSSVDLHKVLTGNHTKLSNVLMKLAEAVREDNTLLREAGVARSGSIDDLNSAFQMNSQADSDTESDTGTSYSEILSIDSDDTPQARCKTVRAT